MRNLATWGMSLLLVVLFGGCHPDSRRIFEGTREANHQNKDAGLFVAAKAEDPAVKQAGNDISANAETVEQNLGAPEKPKPYSPEASAATRDKAKQEKKDADAIPWWQLALAGVGTFLGGNLFTRLFGVIAPRIVGGPLGGALVAVVEGITRVREDIRGRPPGEQHITEEDLLKLLGESQKDPKIQELIAGLAHKLESRLSLRL